MVDLNTINVNGNKVTLTLSWGEPFNNFDPIVNYFVFCSVGCPHATTTDNTTRSYTFTNLIPNTNYMFFVRAVNSVGYGMNSVVMFTTPSSESITTTTTSASTTTTTVTATAAATSDNMIAIVSSK